MKATIALTISVVLLCAAPIFAAQGKVAPKPKPTPKQAAAVPAINPNDPRAAEMKARLAAEEARKAEIAKKTVGEVLRESGDTTFLTLLQRAELVKTLDAGGPYTILAPSEGAFAKVPKADMAEITADKAKLADFLKGLIASPKSRSVDMMVQKEIKMLNNETRPTSVQNYKVHIEEAEILKKDLEYKTGVVHEIDTVLISKMPVVTPAPAPAIASTAAAPAKPAAKAAAPPAAKGTKTAGKGTGGKGKSKK